MLTRAKRLIRLHEQATRKTPDAQARTVDNTPHIPVKTHIRAGFYLGFTISGGGGSGPTDPKNLQAVQAGSTASDKVTDTTLSGSA
jgi:hypothetical protein